MFSLSLLVSPLFHNNILYISIQHILLYQFSISMEEIDTQLCPFPARIECWDELEKVVIVARRNETSCKVSLVRQTTSVADSECPAPLGFCVDPGQPGSLQMFEFLLKF